MRLDATKGDHGWQCYHAELCREIEHVRWLDDEIAIYATVVWPHQMVNGEVVCHLFAAKRIVILPERRLVIINPVGDLQAELRQVEFVSGGL